MGGSAGKLNTMEKGHMKIEKTEAAPTQPHQPGEGLRSLKTSNAFRVLNFELYAKPVRYATS